MDDLHLLSGELTFKFCELMGERRHTGGGVLHLHGIACIARVAFGWDALEGGVDTRDFVDAGELELKHLRHAQVHATLVDDLWPCSGGVRFIDNPSSHFHGLACKVVERHIARDGAFGNHLESFDGRVDVEVVEGDEAVDVALLVDDGGHEGIDITVDEMVCRHDVGMLSVAVGRVVLLEHGAVGCEHGEAPHLVIHRLR